MALPRGAAALLPALLLAAPALGDAQAALAERTRMLALDARCGLAEPAARAALQAGRDQARGALARAGASDVALAAFERRAAASADGLACEGAEALAAQARIADAHAAWAGLGAMDFPANQRSWRAARPRYDGPAWLVRQDLDEAGAAFGLARGEEKAQPALIVPADLGGRLRTARLYVRDPERAAQPVAPGVARLILGPDADPLALAAAPDALSATYWAAGRASPLETERLAGGADAMVLWFAPEALAALSRLGPREAACLEIERADRQGKVSLQRIYLAAGDLSAALAFALPPTPES